MNYPVNQGSLPATMQAITLAGLGFDKLAVTTLPMPPVGPNQLLCRVDAAGVCTSILKIMVQGRDHPFLNGWDLARFPIILGDEGALTVVKAGAHLQNRYRIGERFGIQPAVDHPPILYRERYQNGAEGMQKCAVGYTLEGCLAEYILIQEEVLAADCLIPLPGDNPAGNSLPYFAVALAEPISCVHSAQQRHFHFTKQVSPCPQARQTSPAPRQLQPGLLPGGTTVIIGAGLMGRIHAELALRFRPRHLFVTDIVPERLRKVEQSLRAKAEKAGTRLYTVTAAALAAQLAHVTDKRGADDIIVAVGSQPVQQDALKLAAKGGVVNLFGGLPRGKHLLQLDAMAVHYDELKVVGSSGGDAADLKEALESLAQQALDPGHYVFAIGSLDQAPQALQLIQENKVEGRIILYPQVRQSGLHKPDYWDANQEERYLQAHSRA
jgi:threonine dehydrogenase-like Zn-dependent dehydrogenase